MMNQCHDHIGFRRDGSRSKGCGMRPRMLMAVLIMALGILGYIAYTHATADTRPRPANYRAAVMRVLDDQRVDCRTYAGSVRVLATTTLLGQIDCRERWITCTITIPQAGIRAVALDDTIDPLTARWDTFSGQVQRWLRSASHGFAQQ